jgi:chaperonin cofactor prefoldin
MAWRKQSLGNAPAASLSLKVPFSSTPAASLPLMALLLAMLLAGSALAAEGNTYRYINDRGQRVFADRVPPQFVKNGYEVLNSRGQVIQVVPRALTPAELAALEATREQREAEEAAANVQREADNLLLRLYRSPDEIARKRDERVSLIDGQLTALTASMEKLRTEVANLQRSADSQVAAGREAPPQTVESLRIQGAELERQTTQRDRLQSDRAAVIADADRDMSRLAELMGLPEQSAAD